MMVSDAVEKAGETVSRDREAERVVGMVPRVGGGGWWWLVIEPDV